MPYILPDALGFGPPGLELAEAPALAGHTHAAGSHPDLATHDALGLATDAELTTHEGAADPHTVYLLSNAQKLTVGSIAPSSPVTDDLWYDTGA